VVAKLDLKDFDAELSVLSARKANIERVQRLIDEYGSDAQKWLPLFMDGKGS
jgi:type IV secretion system protein VirB4